MGTMKHKYVLGLFLLAACSSTNVDTNKGVDPMSTPDGLCQKWAEAACNDTVVTDCAATSKAACVATQKAVCQSKLTQHYQTLSFVVAKSNACVEAVKQAYSDARLTPAEYATVMNFGPPCDTLTTAAADAGSAPDCDAATCQPGGYPCSPPSQGCISGFYCNAGTCTVLPGQGQPCCMGFASCTTELPCQATSYCSGNEGSQTCQARPGLGANCSQTVPCTQDYLCSDPTNGVCAQALTMVPTGPVCANLK
jgi:hypothetical protein